MISLYQSGEDRLTKANHKTPITAAETANETNPSNR